MVVLYLFMAIRPITCGHSSIISCASNLPSMMSTRVWNFLNQVNRDYQDWGLAYTLTRALPLRALSHLCSPYMYTHYIVYAIRLSDGLLDLCIVTACWILCIFIGVYYLGSTTQLKSYLCNYASRRFLLCRLLIGNAYRICSMSVNIGSWIHTYYIHPVCFLLLN